MVLDPTPFIAESAAKIMSFSVRSQISEYSRMYPLWEARERSGHHTSCNAFLRSETDCTLLILPPILYTAWIWGSELGGHRGILGAKI